MFLKKKTKYWINELYNWLFCCQKEYLDYTFFVNKEAELMTLLSELLQEENLDKIKAEQQAALFFESIIVLHEMLLHDLDSVLKFDPAAKSKNEVLLTYPGFFAVSVYRIANILWRNQNYILARLIAEYAHSKTGIDIHRGATIGGCFFIDHATGIVIGETALIGKNVKIYQGVTLGALSVNKEEQNKKRHPTIEDGVIIYANASILGGATIIGKNSTIGGNVWITSTIPEQSMVSHKSEISIKNKHNFPEAINFSI